MVSTNNKLTILIIWYSLAVIELFVFLYGYFPLSNNVSNTIVKPPTYINNVKFNANIYQPQVEKVIFIIIDALRRDFVNQQYMPYLNSRIYNEENCLLDVKVEPPTVTLPRIKAITTGSVPQFIDLILNFANSEIQEDSILHRAKESGKKIVFYGDDTWLKLYPNMFLRSEGTTSFYVTDYTEVDNNVTRHLPKELTMKDWDLLFLHYLGLDHIGHIYGPYHSLIKIKLQEMDRIIQTIAEAIKFNSSKTIIMICGDHGMRDSGGHGGTSTEEIVVPLAVLGLSCDTKLKNTIAQIDIAPTIAALMSLPLPADNMGLVRSEFMPCSKETLLYMFHYNALNLIEKNSVLKHEFQYIFKMHEEFLMKTSSTSLNKILVLYEKHLRQASNMLVKKSGSQQISLLYLSCSTLITISVAILVPAKCFQFLSVYITNICLVLLNLIYPEYEFIYLTYILCFISVIIFLYHFPSLCISFLKLNFDSFCAVLIGGTLSQIILLASSSFIEEEHQIWFFIWNSFVIFVIYKELQSKVVVGRNIIAWIMLIGVLRILRHLNHIGNMASVPDISDWLLQDNNRFLLNVLFVTGLMGTNYFCIQISNKDKLLSLLTLCTLFAIFCYRIYVNYHTTVMPARIAEILILMTIIIRLLKQDNVFKTLTIAWILWISLLMRPQNVILIPVCIIISKLLCHLTVTKTYYLEHLWLAAVLYHCQGTYNNLASIDISAGYIGVSYYSPVITSFQIICHTYAFQTLTLLLLLSSQESKTINSLYTCGIYRIFNMTYTCIIAIIHRNHLFIWTVFSPKLLIEVSHTLYIFACLLLYMFINSLANIKI